MRFIMIDEIVDLEPGVRIAAVKTMSSDEDVFRDHFPGFPVVPGVLLIEMMAQAAGKCLDAEGHERGKAMLLKINRGSFRRWVHPDEKIVIAAGVTGNTAVSAIASCTVSVGGNEVGSAELVFGFVPRATLAADYHDDVLERYLERPRR